MPDPASALNPDGFYCPSDWTEDQLRQFARDIDPLVGIDLGIIRAVKILRDAGFSTIESCEGGEGHAYAEPTIKFDGTRATGWAVASKLMEFGLPLRRIGQMWSFTEGVPTGPRWFVTFRRKV